MAERAGDATDCGEYAENDGDENSTTNDDGSPPARTRPIFGNATAR